MSQKGLALIYLLTSLATVIILLAPIPYYRGQVICDPPCFKNCPPCPKPGWYLGDPIWKRVFDYFYNINKRPSEGDLMIAITPSPTPKSLPKNSTILIPLGQQFTLRENQIAKISNTGLEIKITAFYNNPCPAGTQCIWSGVGIKFEYHLNGEVQKGIDLVQAFGHQTTVVKSDYETYAVLVIEKIQ